MSVVELFYHINQCKENRQNEILTRYSSPVSSVFLEQGIKKSISIRISNYLNYSILQHNNILIKGKPAGDLISVRKDGKSINTTDITETEPKTCIKVQAMSIFYNNCHGL